MKEPDSQLLAAHEAWLMNPQTKRVLELLQKERLRTVERAENLESKNEHESSSKALTIARTYRQIYEYISDSKAFVARFTDRNDS